MAFYSLFAPARISNLLSATPCRWTLRNRGPLVCVSCRQGPLSIFGIFFFPVANPTLIMDTVSDACGGERGDFGFTAYPLPKPAWRAVRLLEARGTGRRPCSRCASHTAPQRKRTNTWGCG